MAQMQYNYDDKRKWPGAVAAARTVASSPKEARMHAKSTRRRVFVCEQCGITFSPKKRKSDRPHRYCSTQCRNSAASGRRTHGMSRSPLYQRWRSMHYRCRSPKCPEYPYYGGRGITVCEEWRDFGVFYRDMGDPPPGHELDRIDTNGPYCKENCRWVPKIQNARNRRDSIQLTAFGETKPIGQWANEIGLDRKTLHKRLQRGWSVEDTVSIRTVRKPKGGAA